MKTLLVTTFLASAFAFAGGCASHQDSMDNPPPQQPNSVGVSTPAPNADPNNPDLTHKGINQTGGDTSASGTSANGNK